jgi:glycosyltransferase involved in cell wall biosynthesis
MSGASVRVRIGPCRAGFRPRAEWVLGIMIDALGRSMQLTEGPADLVYAPDPPDAGVWIPADARAQEFFSQSTAFSTKRAFFVHGAPTLFGPCAPSAPIDADLVASAFHFLVRWDEHCVSARDRFGRLPFTASTFGQVAGLDPLDPPVERYIGLIADALGIDRPAGWQVYLTNDIDDLRMRTPQTLTKLGKQTHSLAPGGRSALVGADPWNNVGDLLWSMSRRGLASTVFLIGSHTDPHDGSPARVYAAQRARIARAVRGAGGEVALHTSFGGANARDAFASELAAFQAEIGPPILGARAHYLRFRYHATPAWIEAAGLAYEASSGWPERPGFACGIARPFAPWILGDERPARIDLVPLAVSDWNLWAAQGLEAEPGLEAATRATEVIRRHGGAAAILWHNSALADPRAPGYGQVWEDLLDSLVADGAWLGPIRPPATPAGADLSGRRILHLTSVHRPRDVRILHKHASAAARAGAHADVLGLREPVRRTARIGAGWRLVRRARKERADIYHVHDPELLPAALWLRLTSRKPVVYDVHEYLGETVRTKSWLPAAIRRPLAVLVSRLERSAGAHCDAVVGVNEDLAARFALAGAPKVRAVTNAPWGHDFPAPQPFREPVVLYVGGLAPVRGLEVMRDAARLLRTPGARVVLAGPGDPGELPASVTYLGVVDHSEVPDLLAHAAVAWIPLQVHENYARAVPTKLVEAMAAGRPVVASDFGRMAAIVRQSGCGLLVPADDPAAHAEAIDRLFGDPELAARLGAAGRRAFDAGLSYERQADRLTSLYAEVLEGR